MKRFMIAIALCCVLSSPALAGLIPSVPVAPPPREDEAQATRTTSPGDIPSDGYTDEMSAAALNLIQMMMGVIV